MTVIAKIHSRSNVKFEDFKGTLTGFIPEDLRKMEPELVPMRGRVVVRLVKRMDRFPDYSRWAKLVHRADLNPGEMDQRFQYQPYIGHIIAFGEPTDAQEKALAEDAKKRAVLGEPFIFTWGAGIDFSSEAMMMLEKSARDDSPRFEWLANIRLFRIKDIGASLRGCDEFGGSNGEEVS